MKKISKLKVLIFSVLFSTLDNFFEKMYIFVNFWSQLFYYKDKKYQLKESSKQTPNTNNEQTKKKF